MKSIFIKSKDLNNLTKAFNSINENDSIKSLMVLMADKNHYINEELEPLLKSNTKTIIGGVFPALIFEGKNKDEGVLLIPSNKQLETAVFDLDNTEEQNNDILINKFDSTELIKGTLMVYVHGFGNKFIFLDSIFNYFGNNVNYLGAGTGSINEIMIPSIIDNDGIHKNAGIIGLNDEKIDIGVAHGWYPISKPLKVTKTDGTKVIKINWESAFDVYKEIVEAHSGLKFTNENYSEIAKSYPIGLSKVDAEMLVRDPLSESDGALNLIESIDEGEYLYVLHGTKELLLEGAKKAKEKALQGNKDKVFCVDCITRVAFLEDQFKDELKSISENGNVEGVISLGEIGNTGESFLESYNKTVIVAKW